nr:hypothetical protein [uncultured Mediterranean phage uvMED]
MKNCFTETISYLDHKYDLPQVWGKWTWSDLEAFVKHQNKFLARKDHIGFFDSFCQRVKHAQADDVILWDRGVGVCINQFFYWTYDHIEKGVVTRRIENNAILMRLNHE